MTYRGLCEPVHRSRGFIRRRFSGRKTADHGVDTHLTIILASERAAPWRTAEVLESDDGFRPANPFCGPPGRSRGASAAPLSISQGFGFTRSLRMSRNSSGPLSSRRFRFSRSRGGVVLSTMLSIVCAAISRTRAAVFFLGRGAGRAAARAFSTRRRIASERLGRSS